MANKVLEMKKHKMRNNYENFPESKSDRIDALLLKDKATDFGRFICHWMLVSFIVIALFGMGIWLI